MDAVLSPMAISRVKCFIFVNIVFQSLLVDDTMADCRVMADCDGGQLQWQQLAHGPPGPPGKRVSKKRLMSSYLHLSY